MIPALISGGLQIGGLLGSWLGGNQQNRQTQDLINYARGGANNILDFVNGSTLGAGYAPGVIDQSLWPLMGFGQSTLDGLNPAMREWLGQNSGQIGNYYANTLPGLMNPSDPYANPAFGAFNDMSSLLNSRYNFGLDTGLTDFNARGWNPYNAATFDYASRMGQGQNDYLASLLDYGNYGFKNGGIYDYNRNAIDVGNWGVNTGGWTGQNSGAFDLFSGIAANPYTSSILRGQGRAEDLMSFGQGLAGTGLNLLPQVDRFSNMDPESFLGQRGSGALDSLAASPFIGGTYNTVQNLLRQGTSNYGYTPYDTQMMNGAAPRFFNSYDSSGGQFNDAWNLAMSKGAGNLDALPDWFNTFAMNAPGFNGNEIGGGMGGFLSGLSGGGGGGASAGALSRDLGVMDPKVREILDKGMAAFDGAEILSLNKAASMARDQAATSAKQQAEAVARKAVNLGGIGATGFGGRNQAYADFADQALENEAKAIQNAVLQQQGLTLQKAGMGADLAKAMQAADTQRQGLMANMNISDADNQTRASIASAQNADSAANRQMQIGLAQQQNALAAAQMKSAVFQSMLNSATNLRGQNVDSSNAGLSGTVGLQNAMNGRMALLNDAINGAGNRANTRYASTLGVTPQLNDSAGLDINRWNTIIQPLVAGQSTGTARAGNYSSLLNGLISGGANFSNIGADLFTGLENSAANRFGSATTGVGSSLNAANNTLAAYTDLLKTGLSDSFNRMSLGANSVNNALGQMFNWTGLSNSAGNDMLNFGLNSGRLSNDFLNGQRGLNNDLISAYATMSGLDLNNRRGTSGIFNDYASTMNNSWNPLASFAGMGLNTMNGINDRFMNYSGRAMDQLNNYSRMLTWSPGTPTNGMSALGAGLTNMGQNMMGRGGFGGFGGGGGTGGFSAGGFNFPGFSTPQSAYGIPGLPANIFTGPGGFTPQLTGPAAWNSRGGGLPFF